MVYKNRILDVCFKEINLVIFFSCGRIFYRFLIKKNIRRSGLWYICNCSMFIFKYSFLRIRNKKNLIGYYFGDKVYMLVCIFGGIYWCIVLLNYWYRIVFFKVYLKNSMFINNM